MVSINWTQLIIILVLISCLLETTSSFPTKANNKNNTNKRWKVARTPINKEMRTPIRKEVRTPVKKEMTIPIKKEVMTPIKKEMTTAVKKEVRTAITKEVRTHPQQVPCPTEGFYRHPENCRKFYRCVDLGGSGDTYLRYHFDCAPGTVFDDRISVCNHPYAAPACDDGDSEGAQGEGTDKPVDGNTTPNGNAEDRTDSSDIPSGGESESTTSDSNLSTSEDDTHNDSEKSTPISTTPCQCPGHGEGQDNEENSNSPQCQHTHGTQSSNGDSTSVDPSVSENNNVGQEESSSKPTEEDGSVPGEGDGNPTDESEINPAEGGSSGTDGDGGNNASEGEEDNIENGPSEGTEASATEEGGNAAGEGEDEDSDNKIPEGEGNGPSEGSGTNPTEEGENTETEENGNGEDSDNKLPEENTTDAGKEEESNGENESSGSETPPSGGSQTSTTDDGDEEYFLFQILCGNKPSFRRHPLYCGRYYKCVAKGDNITFTMHSCADEEVFSNSAGECVAASQAPQCNAPKSLPYNKRKRVNKHKLAKREILLDNTRLSRPQFYVGQLNICPNETYLSSYKDCSKQYDCMVTDKLKTHVRILYNCPAGFLLLDVPRYCGNEQIPYCGTTFNHTVYRLRNNSNFYRIY